MAGMADMITHWDMCACWEYLETPGEWYPRACSKSCAKDYSCSVA